MDIIIPIDSEKGLIRKFFGLTGRILMEPSKFFRQDLNLLSWSEAMTFGIVGAWISTLIAFVWETLNSLFLIHFFEKWVQTFFASEEAISLFGEGANGFLWSAGLLLLTPFLLLLRLFFSSLAVYFFAKLLIEPNERALEQPSLPGIIRIFGVSLAGSWFCVVPILGAPISFVARMVLAVTGIRERYGISTRRSMAVVFGPYLFFVAMLFLFLLVALLFLSQMPLQELLDLDQGM